MTALERVRERVEDFNQASDNILDDILNIIDSETKRGDWISVDERLPEKADHIEDDAKLRYLVQDENGKYRIAYYVGLRLLGNTFWCRDKGPIKAVAWMDAPQPWEGEL